MAFLDNSGDIILDAVLTDTGRMRLARGDGSFKIVKFALGDDEINYENYDLAHPSGSAYYDLEVMQTPILEAFTNNASSMKSQLISISRNDLLYLPVLKLNTLTAATAQNVSGGFFVAVDTDTEKVVTGGTSRIDGILYGVSKASPGHVFVNQGLDATDSSGNPVISPAQALDADLVETQYIIEIDNRLGSIKSNNDNLASVSFIDDDNIASYYLSLGSDIEYITENKNREVSSTETVAGPRGTNLTLGIQASLELNTSTYLFSRLGGFFNMVGSDGSTIYTMYYIDSTVRVVGATTGSSLDIPVRFIKKYS